MSSSDDISTIKLDQKDEDIVKSYLDTDGKLSCLKAFTVARKIKHDVSQMSMITKSMGIKISNCELSVFGNLNFSDKDQSIYENLEKNYVGTKNIDCKGYWDEAKTSSLHKVGSTVKNSDLEVINCQLGCFKEKKGKKNGS
ncbi:ModE family transcriptional regulator [Arcobacteraceae bacterium]|nr:ModE family transcriptional regulator [Arcobacteraceae bacterium]